MYVPISDVEIADKSIDWVLFEAKNSNLQLGHFTNSSTIIRIYNAYIVLKLTVARPLAEELTSNF